MSDRSVVLRRAAKLDLARQFRWLESKSGTDSAERFLSAADASFAELLQNPLLGPSIRSRYDELADLRKWRVKGFADLLVFYLPLPQRIQIVRVLHAAADWQSLFAAD